MSSYFDPNHKIFLKIYDDIDFTPRELHPEIQKIVEKYIKKSKPKQHFISKI